MGGKKLAIIPILRASQSLYPLIQGFLLPHKSSTLQSHWLIVEAVNVYTLKEYINEQGSITNPDGGELADYAKLYETLDEVIIKLANKTTSPFELISALSVGR